FAQPELSNGQMLECKQHVSRGSEALSNCLESRELKDLHTRMAAERAETVHRIRKARGIDVSTDRNDQVKQWAKDSHEQDINNPAWSTKNDEYLFNYHAGDNPNDSHPVCILAPESIYSPYWQEGQIERQDIRAGQQGIDMRLALQVIDLETCRPMEGAQVDLWQANAAGTYSAQATDSLRGKQHTSNWGTADFDTIFPGHYSGRATHVHVAVRAKGETKVLHAGQIYWDEWLRICVESTEQYLGNEVPVTLNLDDGFIADAATDKYDPFAKWAWLGQNYPYDGIISWTVIGINRSAQVTQPSKRDHSFFD
ncbi:aromatic compound dioxygenase, partial [Byssothecium circinans]